MIAFALIALLLTELMYATNQQLQAEARQHHPERPRQLPAQTHRQLAEAQLPQREAQQQPLEAR